jgi:hypothetical protein
MIAFAFSIGKAFLRSSRPITIPKAYYETLETESLAADAIVLVVADKRFHGTIYYGHAGWGPYYQIRAREKSVEIPDEFVVGHRIAVSIERTAAEIIVTLETPNS